MVWLQVAYVVNLVYTGFTMISPQVFLISSYNYNCDYKNAIFFMMSNVLDKRVKTTWVGRKKAKIMLIFLRNKS